MYARVFIVTLMCGLRFWTKMYKECRKDKYFSQNEIWAFFDIPIGFNKLANFTNIFFSLSIFIEFYP